MDRVEVDRLEDHPAEGLEAAGQVADAHAEQMLGVERAAREITRRTRPQFSVPPPGT